MRMISILRQPKYPILLGGIIIPIALGLVAMAIERNKEGEIKGYVYVFFYRKSPGSLILILDS